MPKRAPTIVERARETSALLDQLFSSMDSLRAAAESCRDHQITGQARDMKQQVAATGVLPWLRALAAVPPPKHVRTLAAGEAKGRGRKK